MTFYDKMFISVLKTYTTIVHEITFEAQLFPYTLPHTSCSIQDK